MYGSQRKDNPKHPLLHLHLPTIRHKESIQNKVHENIFVKETPLWIAEKNLGNIRRKNHKI
jgi:hypothetical protein